MSPASAEGRSLPTTAVATGASDQDGAATSLDDDMVIGASDDQHIATADMASSELETTISATE